MSDLPAVSNYRFALGTLAVVTVWFLSPVIAYAQSSLTPVHIFGSVRCESCVEARQYLEFVAKQEKAAVTYHDVAANESAAVLSRRVAHELGVSINDYPLVVIGDKAFIGWSTESQGPKVSAELQSQRSTPRPDAVAKATAELADVDNNQDEIGPDSQKLLLVLACVVGAIVAVGVVVGLRRRSGKPGLPVSGQ